MEYTMQNQEEAWESDIALGLMWRDHDTIHLIAKAKASMTARGSPSWQSDVKIGISNQENQRYLQKLWLVMAKFSSELWFELNLFRTELNWWSRSQFGGQRDVLNWFELIGSATIFPIYNFSICNFLNLQALICRQVWVSTSHWALVPTDTTLPCIISSCFHFKFKSASLFCTA
jgi:hypothetical protein